MGDRLHIAPPDPGRCLRLNSGDGLQITIDAGYEGLYLTLTASLAENSRGAVLQQSLRLAGERLQKGLPPVRPGLTSEGQLILRLAPVPRDRMEAGAKTLYDFADQAGAGAGEVNQCP